MLRRALGAAAPRRPQLFDVAASTARRNYAPAPGSAGACVPLATCAARNLVAALSRAPSLQGPLTARASRGFVSRPPPERPGWRPIRKIMAANRGEIAIRIFRAATEMNIKTVAIYSKEDFGSLHRYKADESFLVGKGKSPIAAYLSAEEIVEKAVEHGVDAIHPGYGFLSENVHFARLCEANGIAFVGPESSVLNKFGDKTLARQLAIDAGVPVVPGTDGECNTHEEVRSFIEDGPDPVGYPVIVKAAHGGGGRGMRVVRSAAELEENLARAQSEALTAFGNAAVFVERYVEAPRHVEVQILSDGETTFHLYERDCSVQRRFQKVVEIAPSVGLPEDLQKALHDDAVRLTSAAGYRAAGTVEFLVDPTTWNHYFIEVNPRIQVEHTVTEVVTGVDLVQSQIRVAQGETLAEIGLDLRGNHFSAITRPCWLRRAVRDPQGHAIEQASRR